MCFFLTIGVPGGDVAVLEAAVPRGLAVSLIENQSVLRRLPADYRTYVLISGMCSCGLFMEPARAKKHTAETHAAKLRRRYAKLGWSQAKVERAVAQASARPEPEQEFVGLRPDVRELLADVAEQVGALALVVHWYDGLIDTEKFEITPGPECDPSALREGLALHSPDVLVSIRLGRPRIRR